MATSTKSINATGWTAITTVGQSGSCWLPLIDSNDVFVDHTETALGADCALTKSFRVRYPKDNKDVCLITADSATDVFYARCAATGQTATLIVDVK